MDLFYSFFSGGSPLRGRRTRKIGIAAQVASMFKYVNGSYATEISAVVHFLEN
jgi:hypothetical protein